LLKLQSYCTLSEGLNAVCFHSCTCHVLKKRLLTGAIVYSVFVAPIYQILLNLPGIIPLSQSLILCYIKHYLPYKLVSWEKRFGLATWNLYGWGLFLRKKNAIFKIIFNLDVKQ
jgi:hypothetical protein